MKTIEEFTMLRIPHKLLTDSFIDEKVNQKYVQSSVAKDRLNKALGTSYLMVWERGGVESITNKDDNEWDWNESRFYALRPDGELLFFWNSEWGGVVRV